jgi:uncharacterized protein (DUF952 family)
MNLYHIADRAVWAAAQESASYVPASLASEGFIHCSTASQVLAVAHRFYAGQSGLVLLVIDPARLEPTLKWEQVSDQPASPSGEPDPTFPHIYGPMNLDAVTEVLDFEPGTDGTFRAPAALGGDARDNPQ